MFPAVYRVVVTSVSIDLFLGSEIIECSITIGEVLLKKICACPNANQIIFGIKCEKDTDPAVDKKILLLLLVTRIIGCNV